MSNNLNFSNSNIPTDLSSFINNVTSSQVQAPTSSPLQTTDQISLADLFPNLNGSPISTNPVLPMPLEVDNVRPDPQTPMTNEQFSQLLNQILPEFPEFNNLSSLVPNGPTKQDISSRLETLLKNGKLNEHNFSAQAGKVVGQLIMQEIQKNPQLASQLTAMLDSVRVKTFGESYPAIDIAVDKEAEKLIQQGLSKEQAYVQARTNILNMIDSNLKEQGVFQTVLGNHPKLSPAINEALLKVLTDSYGDTMGTILAKGLSIASDLENTISGFFENLAINPTKGVDPTSLVMTNQQALNIIKGLTDTSETIMKNGDKALHSLPPEAQTSATPGGMSADIKTTHSEWMRNLDQTIQNLKTILNAMEFMEAQKSQEFSRAKNQLTDLQQKFTMKKLQEEMKQLCKPAIIRFFEELGKILASAILSIIGAIAAPFTGGASLAIVVVVTVLLFVLTTVLSETGVLEKGFKKLMEAIATAVEKAGGGPQLQALMKFLMAFVMVAIIIVATVACRSGSIAASAGSSLSGAVPGISAQVGAQLVRYNALIVGTTLIGTMATSSGLFESFAQMTTNDPIKQAYIAMALTIVFVIALAGATMRGISNDIEKAVKEATAGVLSNVQKLAKNGEISQEIAQQFSLLKQADDMKSFVNSLQKEGQISAKIAQSITEGLPEQSSLTIMKALNKVQGVAMVLESSVGVAGAAFQIKVAELGKEVKELEAMIEQIKALIHSLEQLLAAANSEMAGIRQDSKQLGEFFDSVLSNTGQTMSNLFPA